MDSQDWFKDNGDYTHRINYDLNANSVVFDLGGYQGVFAAQIYEKYGSKIYIYEPIRIFYSAIKTKFENNLDVYAFCLGISTENKKANIYLLGDSTSMHLSHSRPTEIDCITLDKAMLDNNVDHIDLLKINIEGEEYPLLEYMIKNKLVEKCVNIQVQFHDFIYDHETRYSRIKSELEKTHKLTYRYPFVWENWEKK